jgi:hypothetical protein
MATPRPKVFRAVVDFSANNVKFRAGDVVSGLPLATVLKFGGRFVIADSQRKPQSDRSAPQVEQPPANQPAESVEKE